MMWAVLEQTVQSSQHSDGLADAGGGSQKLPEATKLPYLEIEKRCCMILYF